MSGYRPAEVRRSHAAYERHRHRMIAYGRWQPYVDAEPVRDHVRQLMSDGLSRRRIAALADVTNTTVIRLLYGQGKKPPSRKIRTESAQALLEIRSRLEILGPTARIDATGTRRRLQALVALGWSRTKLAEALGGHRDVVSRYMLRDQVTVATARAVRSLYDRMWDTAPPEHDRWDASAAAYARRTAERRGWAPPMAWDDETIDDPAAKPHIEAPVVIDEVAVKRALDGDRSVSLTKEERAEAVRIGTEIRLSANHLGKLLGTSARTVVRDRKGVAA